jgi:hypothetical protein
VCGLYWTNTNQNYIFSKTFNTDSNTKFSVIPSLVPQEDGHEFTETDSMALFQTCSRECNILCTIASQISETPVYFRITSQMNETLKSRLPNKLNVKLQTSASESFLSCP